MAVKNLPAGSVAQRVAEAVHTDGDQCFACLAERHGLDEHDVRAAALVLVCRAGLDLARRRCVCCGAREEMLVQRKVA
jgi:hypothetical protein